ncbi:MAG: CPBP family intramembrane metalloprotease [Lachnospiraceae bacterium]|nr:CPBP family intramembrane metalloprotease [Lachnospiraceae bacterium]MBR5789238.1 CPBP family intramembrane metalloprotease [Lachnospiraceae bacterium]
MVSHEEIFSPKEAGKIFDNMSDGVLLVDEDQKVTYFNSACRKIFFNGEEILNRNFEEAFLFNPKNKEFNTFFTDIIKHNKNAKKTLTFQLPNGEKVYLLVEVSMKNDGTYHEEDEFKGMLVMVEDVTIYSRLRVLSHDCAHIFAALIIGICIYLSVWSFCRFTLRIPLKATHYMYMIEGITAILFIDIWLFTSFKMGDIGLLINKKRWKKNIIQTLVMGAIACGILFLMRCGQIWLGLPGKSYFIGGSFAGARSYLITAFFQEFLARGVIQTSLKYILQVKHQRGISVFTTSLLFMMMHLPFGFFFMVGAFALSVVLGFIYEEQEDLYGCALLHWGVGYLAMCLFY